MWKEFKDFLNRGSVMDLAVGVIIGAAVTAVVNSLVEDIISPIIGMFLGGVDFSNLSWQIGDAQILYGAFINALINFFIVAFVLFLIVRSFNKINKKKEDDAPSGPTEVELLQQIRDALTKSK